MDIGQESEGQDQDLVPHDSSRIGDYQKLNRGEGKNKEPGKGIRVTLHDFLIDFQNFCNENGERK